MFSYPYNLSTLRTKAAYFNSQKERGLLALKLGSLFDGIGGFPAAGLMCGIEPVWASEIEKFPCAVTAARFPKMKQLGDITKIKGGDIEAVDIITFGSPCQDLSVAGKQKGIHDGERSNLFFEAIRIIKEMRAATNNKYPRFAVWENVPGAQSRNKGEDFRSVIDAFISIVHNGVSIPRPEKWFRAGGVASDRFSLAWRMYDAQYWGVPQRRKRIYLVADFRGQRAGEILFKSEGVSGNFEQSREAGQGIADNAEKCSGRSSCTCLNPWDAQYNRQFDINGVFHTLSANNGGGGRKDGIVYRQDSRVKTDTKLAARGS